MNIVYCITCEQSMCACMTICIHVIKDGRNIFIVIYEYAVCIFPCSQIVILYVCMMCLVSLVTE